MTERKRRMIVGMMLAVLFIFDLYYFKHFGNEKETASIPTIEIVEAKNEAFYRNEKSSPWIKASENQALEIGDLLSTGKESYMRLKTSKGDDITMAEESRLSYSEAKVPASIEKYVDLTRGNFHINFDGIMKLAVLGQLLVLEGRNAEVEIIIGKDLLPQFRLLGGNAQVRQGSGKPLILENRALTSLPVAASVLAGIPQTATQKGFLLYNWRLYDLYEQRDFQLFERKHRAESFEIVTKLRWNGPKEAHYKVQTWAANDFQNASNFDVNQNFYTTKSAALGLNQWRVSADGKNWSAPSQFEVVPEFLEAAEPTVEVSERKLTLTSNEVKSTVKLSAPFTALGYVAQASTTAGFDAHTTRTFWSTESELHLSFFKSGTYFYRFRSVNSRQQLSEWTKPEQFNVMAPENSLNLKLASYKKPLRKKHAVQLNKNPIETKDVRDIAAVESAEPTSIESSNTLKLDSVRPPPRNQKYHETKISLQGLLWTIQSSQQYYANQNAPVATGLGISGIHWADSQGIEGLFKMGVFGANREGTQTSLKDLEARYHYRFFSGSPFSYAREMQISLFGGVEAYRNVGDNFSNRYDLIKFGTSLEFPWVDRWTMGGELAYGIGFDRSNKQEISGHFNYFLTKDWSLGAGYRLHFFTAGSAASSPGGYLPYREGYTEGFSVLDYHF